MVNGAARIVVYILQRRPVVGAWVSEVDPLMGLHPLSPPMAGSALGNFSSRRWVEADPHWNPAIDRQHLVDRFVHHRLEATMDELKYEKLTETSSRMEADLLESYLEANGIDVELFQEAVGHSIFPVSIDMLGNVQVFVPKEKIKAAKQLLENFTN